MASGMATASLTQSAAVFGLPKGLAPLGLTITPTVRFGLGVFGAAVAVQLVLAAFARQLTKRAASAASLQAAAAVLEEEPLTNGAGTKAAVDAAEPFAADAEKLATVAVVGDLFAGLSFALGLGVSGMVRPSKVAGFLSLLSGELGGSASWCLKAVAAAASGCSCGVHGAAEP